MIIDTHAHLNFPSFESDQENVIDNARKENISTIINIGSGNRLQSNFKSLDIANAHDFIYTTIGFHPDCVEKITENDYIELEKLLPNKKIVAIGEIGLDYHYKSSNIQDQKTHFVRQLDWAHKLNLPVIIHCREAFNDTLTILENYKKLKGVFHCFSGSQDDAKKILDFGFYISLTGVITYKNANNLIEVVKNIPIERILVETDCPFLTPEPFRGKRNEPSYIKYTIQKIAELKELSFKDVARVTKLNAISLFNLPIEIKENVIAYKIRNSLYINLTNKCINVCVFCGKRNDFIVKGHSLHLNTEPDVEDVLKEISKYSNFDEIVFCGYGEPLLRFDALKAIAKTIKEKLQIKIRINTSGLANLYYKRNILPELTNLIDTISVSLNAHDAKTYEQICPSRYKEKSFEAVCDFIKIAKDFIPEVIATAVDLPSIDINKTEKLATEILKVKFRKRIYNEIG